jgi:hypothetical protein
MSETFGIAYRLVVMTFLATIVVIGIIWFVHSGEPLAPDARIAYTQAEFITIILTAITVILAALALVIAMAGVVGYVTIRKAAEDAAAHAVIANYPRLMAAVEAQQKGDCQDVRNELVLATERENYQHGFGI